MPADALISAFNVLIVVALMLFLTYYVTKQIGKMSKIQGGLGYMKIMDRLQIAQDKSVAIVKVCEKYYLLGISQTNISLISEISKDELDNYEVKEIPKVDFSEVLKGFIKKDKNDKM